MGQLIHIREIFRRSAGWWLTLFVCVAILALFLQGTHQQSLYLEEMQARKAELLLRAERLRRENQQLQEQIDAQESVAWGEQRLVHRLGVVPKGAFKVVFLEPSSN
jgi:uncharacterized protein YlxW (UPF0749 family)